MKYQSTRDSNINVSASRAVADGLSHEGGLFVPVTFPSVSNEDILRLADMPYCARAASILRLFLDEFSEEELTKCSELAYDKFDENGVAPVTEHSGVHFLELWHGPTCAFKDMALQMLPHLLILSLNKLNETRMVCILVATSGDTGKAALEGFCDVDGTKIMVFYPQDGVSDIQKLQMTSQNGQNVNVVAVSGNFDDAQNGVKAIFSDASIREILNDKGYFLSSANSINWGRLLPQIVYYFSAYCDLLKNKTISLGQMINFCVPTGNFGNILAGFYAKLMGLPIAKLICASNSNDVLTDFINTGVYDKNRRFHTTISPSMDILVSSNLERLLFELSGKNDAMIRGFMRSLSEHGRFEITSELKTAIDKLFAAGSCSDEDTKKAIAEVFKNDGYLMDTHTAVAYKVLKAYREQSGDTLPAVVVSTASPYKFCDSVLSALGHNTDTQGAVLLTKLSDISKTPCPAPLKSLETKSPRFTSVIEKSDMRNSVIQFLKG